MSAADRPGGATPARARPLAIADRLLDLGCGGFAVWTLLCHLTVFTGGSLHRLLGTAAATAVVAAVWALRRRRAAGQGDPPRPEPTPAARRLPGFVTALGIGVGAALGLALAAGVDPLRLWAPAAAYLGVSALLSLRTPPGAAEAPACRRRAFALWALAAAAALLTAGLSRPDADDALYVSLAVAAVDAPDEPLLASDPLHGVPGLRLDFPTYRVHSFELLAAAASLLTGVEVIAWLHLAFAPALALGAVLATARAARRLAPSRWLEVTAAVVALLVGIANAHAWYGNLAFVRLHQGKGVLVTLVVPLIVAYGLELAAAPNRRAALRLAAAQVAAVGLNATGLWVAPAVGLVAAAAALRFDRRGVRGALLAGLACLYPLLLAAGFSLAMRRPDSPLRPFLAAYEAFEAPADAEEGPAPPARPDAAAQRPPKELALALDRVFLGPRLAVPCALLLLCGWWLSPEPLARRLHLAFAVVVVGVLLCPHLAGPLARSVTGGPTYWRVLWVLPLPLLLALALTASAARWPRRAGRVAALLLVAGFLLLTSERTVMAAANGTSFRPFRLKAPPELEVARAVAAVAPPRAVVVAPAGVAPWLATLHRHPYPLVVRNLYLQPLRERFGAAEVTWRKTTVRTASELEARPAEVRRFLDGVEHFRVDAVCFPASAAHRDALAAGLTRLAFAPRGPSGGYEIWVRSPRPRAPEPAAPPPAEEP